jgi:arsenate reductase
MLSNIELCRIYRDKKTEPIAVKTVLFICIHNAGRSQMAEALFNQAAPGSMRAVSAGTQPSDRIHPVVIRAMLEAGLDLTDKMPKLLTQDVVDRADKIIAMGCGNDPACPVVFVPAEDWELEDPSGQPLETVRIIRDDIQAKVSNLLKELGPPE